MIHLEIRQNPYLNAAFSSGRCALKVDDTTMAGGVAAAPLVRVPMRWVLGSITQSGGRSCEEHGRIRLHGAPLRDDSAEAPAVIRGPSGALCQRTEGYPPGTPDFVRTSCHTWYTLERNAPAQLSR